MVNYNDYLKELKGIADSEIGKHIISFKNEIKALSLKLQNQQENNNKLQTELDKLQNEYYELQQSEKKTREIEEAHKQNLKIQEENARKEDIKKKLLLCSIIGAVVGGIVVGGIVGGLSLLFLEVDVSTKSFNDDIHYYFIAAAIAYFTLIFIFRQSIENLFEDLGWPWGLGNTEQGCIGFVVGGVFAFLIMFLPFIFLPLSIAWFIPYIILGASIGLRVGNWVSKKVLDI